MNAAEEMVKTIKAMNDLVQTLFDPRTYFGKLEPDEIREFLSDLAKGYLEISQLNMETYFKILSELPKGDAEEILKIYLGYISKLEDIFAKMSDNPVYSAYVNAINKMYVRTLRTIQNFNSAVLHSLGFVSRRDVVALSEAYVDLKGDINRESRRILEEVKALRQELEKLKKEVKS